MREPRAYFAVSGMLARCWGVLRVRDAGLGGHVLWRARCPRHPSSGHSITITPPSGPGDRPWSFSCDRGCSLEEISELLNITPVMAYTCPPVRRRRA